MKLFLRLLAYRPCVHVLVVRNGSPFDGRVYSPAVAPGRMLTPGVSETWYCPRPFRQRTISRSTT